MRSIRGLPVFYGLLRLEGNSRTISIYRVLMANILNRGVYLSPKMKWGIPEKHG